MRASHKGAHISGAERIVDSAAASSAASTLVRRALTHAKGIPDAISLKITAIQSPLQIKALPVKTIQANSPEEGLSIACCLLRECGISRADEVIDMIRTSPPMRGAMLVDAESLYRLDTNLDRGVRATCMDAAGAQGRLPASAKSHYAEAIVLASKVAAAPGIVAEICISDDPTYVTGYVASPSIGYQRITCMKNAGDPHGGRIFLCRGIANNTAPTIDFLESTPVLVTDVPPAPGLSKTNRFSCLESELSAIRQTSLWREPKTLMPSGATSIATVANRHAAVLASNDYLGLAHDHRLVAAAAEAASSWGTGTGGSRLVTGSLPIHSALEHRLAEFFGCEASLVFATGYMANVGTISAIVGKGDAILSDELNHASIIDGCRLSGAEVFIYRHCDTQDLRRKLSMCSGYRRRLVVSDGVFSMDGDIAPLNAILDICREYDAFSYIDDAHAIGVIGAFGKGTAEYFGCPCADITIGTLSKALGSEGGFVCASRKVVELLVNRARSFIFSTSPSPAALGAAIAALDILESEPNRLSLLRSNVSFFLKSLANYGIAASSPTAIVPIVVGDENRATEISAKLLEQGFFIPAIRYPTVTRGQARLRVAISSAHSEAILASAANAIAKQLNNCYG